MIKHLQIQHCGYQHSLPLFKASATAAIDQSTAIAIPPPPERLTASITDAIELSHWASNAYQTLLADLIVETTTEPTPCSWEITITSTVADILAWPWEAVQLAANNALTGASLNRILLSEPSSATGAITSTPDEPTADVITTLKQALTAGNNAQQLANAWTAFTQKLPTAFTPALELIALHRQAVDHDQLLEMLDTAALDIPSTVLGSSIADLEAAGLLTDQGQYIYTMHPALADLLKDIKVSNPALSQAFVDIMANFADDLAMQNFAEQVFPFQIHLGNFQQALQLAEHLHLTEDQAALSQSLAVFARNSGDAEQAKTLFTRFSELKHQQGDTAGEAAAYLQLASLATEQQHDIAAATWYAKAVPLLEQQANHSDAVNAYQQLAGLAARQQDYANASHWYQKAVTMAEQLGDTTTAAANYHQLGNIALHLQDTATAASDWQNSLALAATAAPAITASNYHQLGVLANQHGEMTTAQTYLQQAVALAEHLDAQTAAHCYYLLGNLAKAQDDLTAATGYYQQSQSINEKLGLLRQAAVCCGQLGNLAQAQEHTLDAAAWYLQAVQLCQQIPDEELALKAARNYYRIWQAADTSTQAELTSHWETAKLTPTLETLAEQFAE